MITALGFLTLCVSLRSLTQYYYFETATTIVLATLSTNVTDDTFRNITFDFEYLEDDGKEKGVKIFFGKSNIYIYTEYW